MTYHTKIGQKHSNSFVSCCDIKHTWLTVTPPNNCPVLWHPLKSLIGWFGMAARNPSKNSWASSCITCKFWLSVSHGTQGPQKPRNLCRASNTVLVCIVKLPIPIQAIGLCTCVPSWNCVPNEASELTMRCGAISEPALLWRISAMCSCTKQSAHSAALPVRKTV